MSAYGLGASPSIGGQGVEKQHSLRTSSHFNPATGAQLPPSLYLATVPQYGAFSQVP